jgi:thiol-disulfide isomerase/thioredoxin
MNMSRKVFLILFTLTFIACKSDSDKKEEPEKIEIDLLNYQTLEPLLNKTDDITYIINFWATWCKPCVEELPYIEQIYSDYRSKNVEVILVSLDFPDHVESRVIPFIKENNIKAKVVMMIDPDQNYWIPKINKEWSGAIPATLIYNKTKRKFYEQSFTYELLQKELNKFIKTN